MRLATLYLSTLVTFLVVDAIMLGLFITPIFKAEIGHLMVTPIRAFPALMFYFGYVGAVLYLVSNRALQTNNAGGSILPAFVFGLAAYGTYEFTNYAILEAWRFHLVVMDTIWGGVLTAFSAWAGVTITKRILAR